MNSMKITALLVAGLSLSLSLVLKRLWARSKVAAAKVLSVL